MSTLKLANLSQSGSKQVAARKPSGKKNKIKKNKKKNKITKETDQDINDRKLSHWYHGDGGHPILTSIFQQIESASRAATSLPV